MRVCVCVYICICVYILYIYTEKVVSSLTPPARDSHCQSFVTHFSASIAMYVYNFFSKMGTNYTLIQNLLSVFNSIMDVFLSQQILSYCHQKIILINTPTNGLHTSLKVVNSGPGSYLMLLSIYFHWLIVHWTNDREPSEPRTIPEAYHGSLSLSPLPLPSLWWVTLHELGWLVFTGVSDVWGCGCALYAGWVEKAASFSEKLVPGCDAGDLQ